MLKSMGFFFHPTVRCCVTISYKITIEAELNCPRAFFYQSKRMRSFSWTKNGLLQKIISDDHLKMFFKACINTIIIKIYIENTLQTTYLTLSCI